MNVRPARTQFKRTAQRSVARFAAGTRSGKRVVVLGYHSVHPSAPYASASPAEFAAHLDWLVEHCDVVDLASVRTEAPATGRPRVAITFDDGFVDNFTNAFPMLADRGLAATFFLTTGFIERDPAVLGRMAGLWGVPCGDVEPLSWSQARDMAGQGMRFGSHTQSHPNLAELNTAAAVRELRISRDRIEDELGHPVDDLAYPFGKLHRHLNGELVELARAHRYRRAVTVTPRAVRPRDDDLCLPRLVIGGDDVTQLERKVFGGIDAHAVMYEYFPTAAARLSAEEGGRESAPAFESIVSDAPLVSAVLTAYNYGRYLPNAIESVLAQTYANLEVVVVDDGSTDDTARVVEAYADRGVRYLYQANSGAGSARNAGVLATRGPLVAFLDADDMWLPEKIAAQLAHLRAHPEVALVSCHAYGCDPDMQVVDTVWAGTFAASRAHEQVLIRNCVLNPTCVLVRRDALERVGGFSEIAQWEDWDTWLRIAKLFPIGFTNSTLVKVRRHGGGLSPHTGLERFALDEEMLSRHISAVPAWKRPVIRRRARSVACLQAGRTAHEQGDGRVARQLSRRALANDPTTQALRKLAFAVRAHQPARRAGSRGSGSGGGS